MAEDILNLNDADEQPGSPEPVVAVLTSDEAATEVAGVSSVVKPEIAETEQTPEDAADGVDIASTLR